MSTNSKCSNDKFTYLPFYYLSNDSQEHKAILAWTKYANVNLQIKITNQNSTYLQKIKTEQ